MLQLIYKEKAVILQRFLFSGMKGMKKICLFVAVLCAVMAQAAGYPYLVFTNTAGTTTVMGVSDLTMRVSGSSLQVTNSDGTETFTLTDLASMQFSADGSATTAIENVLEADCAVEVFSVTGAQIGSFGSLIEAVQGLNAGAYVIKQGINTQTVVIK